MPTYLALRHTSPPGFFQGVFAALTKARLVTRYPHAGIVVDGQLYHATLKNGVHTMPFDPAGWDLFLVSVDPTLLVNRFTSVKDSQYDWFSLLAFVLPFRVSVARWFYCFELCEYMITGAVPIGRVTPETLLARIENGSSTTHRPMGVVY